MQREAYKEAFKALEIGEENDELSDDELDEYYEAKYKSISLILRTKLPESLRKGLVKKLEIYGEALVTIKEFRKQMEQSEKLRLLSAEKLKVYFKSQDFGKSLVWDKSSASFIISQTTEHKQLNRQNNSCLSCLG